MNVKEVKTFAAGAVTVLGDMALFTAASPAGLIAAVFLKSDQAQRFTHSGIQKCPGIL